MINKNDNALDESVKIIKEIIFRAKTENKKERNTKTTATAKERTKITYDPPLKQNRGI